MVSEKLAPVLVTTKVLTSFDLIVIFIGIVLFINNSAGLAPNGPSMFIIWILAFLTFLIPGNIVTAQLGRMFPQEGSIYVWTHKALGPFWGFFAGFVAWWPGIFGMVFSAALVSSICRFICDFECLSEPWQVGLVVLAVRVVLGVPLDPAPARVPELRERGDVLLRVGDLRDGPGRRGLVLGRELFGHASSRRTAATRSSTRT